MYQLLTRRRNCFLGTTRRLWRLFCLLILLLISISMFGKFKDSPFNRRLTYAIKTKLLGLSSPNYTTSSLLASSLKSRASQNKIIMLAYVDLGSYEMTINFYETSLKKHGIENYLFLSPNVRMCDLLQEKEIACTLYGPEEASDKTSNFGSSEFLKKTNIRTYMVFDVLQMGYNVLHTDVDVIYFSNPFLNLPCLDGQCDMAILWDCDMFNAGFLYIRSTQATLDLYYDMKITAEMTDLNDQLALNNALQRFEGQIKVVRLPEEKYSCGKYFYEDPGRHYADEQSLNASPVVVHNNWIVSMAAKEYRFKEMLQWNNDETGYYSNENRNYISYENPSTPNGHLEADNDIWIREKTALENALMIGKILNRIVILPKFHCGELHCNLLNRTKLNAFDGVFREKYREHLFLKHEKVPRGTSNSLSVKYFIATNTCADVQKKVNARIPSDCSNGPSKSEILEWFGDVKEKVLCFESLYGDFRHLLTLPLGSFNDSTKAFEVAFISSRYIQA